MNKIYFALMDGELIRGAGGTVGFESSAKLRRSIGQNYYMQRLAREKGVKPKDLYTVCAVDITELWFSGDVEVIE
jgi:hypothetical protein